MLCLRDLDNLAFLDSRVRDLGGTNETYEILILPSSIAIGKLICYSKKKLVS